MALNKITVSRIMRTLTNIILAVIVVLVGTLIYMIHDGNGSAYVDRMNRFLFEISPNYAGMEFDTTEYPWRKLLRDNYKSIREEFEIYSKLKKLPRLSEVDPLNDFLDTTFRPEIPWEVLMLRVFRRDTNKMKHFPKTNALLSQIPGCTFAMFSVLYPKKKVPEHFGVFKGVWRYHLALIVPSIPNKSRLKINGQKYYWREGEDVMFDDTYYHEVENFSKNESRVVLFLDVKRDFHNVYVNALNSLFLMFASYHDRVTDIVKRQNMS